MSNIGPVANITSEPCLHRHGAWFLSAYLQAISCFIYLTLHDCIPLIQTNLVVRHTCYTWSLLDMGSFLCPPIWIEVVDSSYFIASLTKTVLARLEPRSKDKYLPVGDRFLGCTYIKRCVRVSDCYCDVSLTYLKLRELWCFWSENILVLLVHFF